MSDAPTRLSGPVALVAATYIYFLLFAEFALLQLAAPFPLAQHRAVLAALGLGGIAGSLLAGRFFRLTALHRHLSGGFGGCAAAVALSLTGPHQFLPLAAGALFTGAALGWLTVTLASGLSALAPPGKLGLVCGLGTGLSSAD